jgi:predicted RecA/RadA family phage recombinase
MTVSNIVTSFTDVQTLVTGTAVVAKTAIKLGTGLFGIPMETDDGTNPIGFATRGRWDLPKTAGGGITFAVGDYVYWSAGTSLATATTSDDLVGICYSTAANADAVVDCELQGYIDPELAAAVNDSDFDAQTILAATLDNTPAALTIAEQRVVGRVTGGNVAALTGTQLATIIPNASTTVVGVAEMATTTEVNTGTDATRGISPSALNGSAPVMAVTNMTGSAAGIDSDSATHIGSNGSDHSFIDQDVTSGAAPTFLGTNMTALSGAAVLETAEDAVLGAIPVVYEIAIAGGADNNVSIAITNKSRVTDAWLVLEGAGTAGSDYQLRNVTSAITEQLDISGFADKTLDRFATIDDAQRDVADGANLNVIWTSTGGDCPAGTVYVQCIRKA